VILSTRTVVNSIVLCFRHFSYGIGVRTQCPNPNLEDQDVSLRLETLLTRLGWQTLPVPMLPSAYSHHRLT
jgi:hypothetical protein